MPTPPLQMLPPPTSSTFVRRARHPSSTSTIAGPGPGPHNSLRHPHRSHHHQHQRSGSISPGAGVGAGASAFGGAFGSGLSALPYPFQVVQTPGGTARAGWWVPPGEVEPERKAAATTLSDGARARHPMLGNATEATSASATAGAGAGANVQKGLGPPTMPRPTGSDGLVTGNIGDAPIGMAMGDAAANANANAPAPAAVDEDLPYFQPR